MFFLALALCMLLSTHMENRRSCLSCSGFFVVAFLFHFLWILVCFFFFPLLILTDQVRSRMAGKGECLDVSMDYKTGRPLLHRNKPTCVAGSYQNKHRCFSLWGIQTALFEACAYDAPGVLYCFMNSRSRSHSRSYAPSCVSCRNFPKIY